MDLTALADHSSHLWSVIQVVLKSLRVNCNETCLADFPGGPHAVFAVAGKSTKPPFMLSEIGLVIRWLTWTNVNAGPVFVHGDLAHQVCRVLLLLCRQCLEGCIILKKRHQSWKTMWRSRITLEQYGKDGDLRHSIVVTKFSSHRLQATSIKTHKPLERHCNGCIIVHVGIVQNLFKLYLVFLSVSYHGLRPRLCTLSWRRHWHWHWVDAVALPGVPALLG